MHEAVQVGAICPISRNNAIDKMGGRVVWHGHLHHQEGGWGIGGIEIMERMIHLAKTSGMRVMCVLLALSLIMPAVAGRKSDLFKQKLMKVVPKSLEKDFSDLCDKAGRLDDKKPESLVSSHGAEASGQWVMVEDQKADTESVFVCGDFTSDLGSVSDETGDDLPDLVPP